MDLTSQPEVAADSMEVPAVPTTRNVARRLMGASAVYGSANFGLRALNFLLLPVYTHYLTPTDYGIIVIAETVALLLIKIIGSGFDAAIQRLYFQHVDQPEMLASYVSSALKFALTAEGGFLLLMLTAGPWLQHTFAPGFSVPFIYLAIALSTAAAAQFFDYRQVLYQCERRPKAFALLAFFWFFLTASLCVTLVVFRRMGVRGMLEGKLYAALVGLAVALYLARRVFHARFRWSYVRETIALGMPLVPHQLMALGLVAADRFILQHYRDLREVGLYSMAYAFGNIMSLVTISLCQAWSPVYYDLGRHGDEGRRVLGRMSSGLLIVLTAIACFGALIAQGFVARFLDARYVSAGRVVPWIIGAYLAHSAFALFSIASLQARRSQFLMRASILALVMNTILNFALIPRWGMYGAAYATIIAYVIEAVVMYVLSQGVFRLDYDLPRTFAALGVFTGVLFVTQIRWAPLSPASSLVNIAAGLAAFGALAALGFDRIKLLRLGLSKAPAG